MTNIDKMPGVIDVAGSVRAQAKLRAVVGLPVISALLITLLIRNGPSFHGLGWAGLVAPAHIGYILAMLLLTAHPRRFSAKWLAIGTAILDPLMLSAWLPMMGEVGGLIVGFYLFTILGFGFRIGHRLMLLCQAASIAGFVTVVLLEPFWRQHHLVWLSFLATLIVVPLYATLLVRKMHEARAHAERESQAKSQLLAKVSHELRTPLSGIVAAAQLLSAESEDHQVTNRAETIMGLSRDLLREINDLLDQAKYEAKALVLESTLFDMQEQVERLHLNLESAARKKELAFAVTLDPAINARVQGDSHYLSKVLMNLAGNAIKFTEKGKVEIAIKLLEEQGERYKVRFSVQDTGIGVPRELHDKIFEPFFQADGSTARKYGGTGLGMTIAKEIVTLMGGDIRVESHPGVGSLFYFDLSFPIVRTRQRSSVKFVAPAVVYGKRILVVDDNATNLSLIGELLLRDRHEVVPAISGTKALEVLTQRDFDLIFLDFNLGDMDGAKVLQIYRFGRLKPAPVFFLTADATATTEAKLRSTGAAGILHKPVTMEVLRQAIAQVCSTGEEARPAPAGSQPPTAMPHAATSQLPLAPVPTLYIDYSVIDGLKAMSGRPEFLAEVLGSAVTDIERNCNELIQALTTRDSARVRDTAHALKGVCTTVGAKRLESLINRLLHATSEELLQAGTRLRTEINETSRQSVATIRNALLDRAVND